MGGGRKQRNEPLLRKLEKSSKRKRKEGKVERMKEVMVNSDGSERSFLHSSSGTKSSGSVNVL